MEDWDDLELEFNALYSVSTTITIVLVSIKWTRASYLYIYQNFVVNLNDNLSMLEVLNLKEHKYEEEIWNWKFCCCFFF